MVSIYTDCFNSLAFHFWVFIYKVKHNFLYSNALTTKVIYYSPKIAKQISKHIQIYTQKTLDAFGRNIRQHLLLNNQL